MSLFEPPGSYGPMQTRYRQPAWAAPPENMVGRTADVGLLLVRTDVVAVAAEAFVAYPVGAALRVLITSRNEDLHEDPFGVHSRLGRHGASGGTPAGGPLRLGFGYADGRTATSRDAPPDGPILFQGGGGGGGGLWRWDFWLWPLPPPGPLAFVAAWEDVGLPETRVEGDATALATAARGVVELWPEDRPEPPGEHFTFDL